MYDILCIANNRHGVTITTHAIKRHFLNRMTAVRQPKKRLRSCVLTLKYTFICVYWWTRQRIQNTLIAVDWYLWLMGDKTIPDSAEPLLESFYPPFVAGIDLPHQGVVDSYNLRLHAKVKANDRRHCLCLRSCDNNHKQLQMITLHMSYLIGWDHSCISQKTELKMAQHQTVKHIL